jgi:hypothetical protein
MGWWRDNDPRSEYGGKGVLNNTLFPKGDDALTPSDKLRLDSLTGQHKSALAEPDQYHWYGQVDPGSVVNSEKEATLRDSVLPDPYPRGY